MNFSIKKVKIFVTVPKEDLKEVRTAMCNAGAGVIGDYTFCSTSIKSVGTFVPNDDATHTLESKINWSLLKKKNCDIEKVKQIIQALRKNIHMKNLQLT